MNSIDRDIKSLNTFLAIKGIASLLFTIVLICFEALPIIGASETQYVTQASLQRTRSQIFVKSALVLVYRPSVERTAAISDLETVVPLFEQEQAILTANTALEVQVLIAQARPDYLALDQAAKSILANQTGKIDPTQVNIILAHERAYLITMNTLLVVLNQQVYAHDYQLFLIEMSISITIILFIIVFIIVTRHMVKSIVKEVKIAVKSDEKEEKVVTIGSEDNVQKI